MVGQILQLSVVIGLLGNSDYLGLSLIPKYLNITILYFPQDQHKETPSKPMQALQPKSKLKAYPLTQDIITMLPTHHPTPPMTMMMCMLPPVRTGRMLGC